MLAKTEAYLEELARLRVQRKKQKKPEAAKQLRDAADDALFHFTAAWLVLVPQHGEVLVKSLELIGRYIESVSRYPHLTQQAADPQDL